MSRRNITITVEEEVARWARIRAAEQDVSVSRLLGDMLEERMQTEARYSAAMRQYLDREAGRLKEESGRYPRREELHDRTGLR